MVINIVTIKSNAMPARMGPDHHTLNARTLITTSIVRAIYITMICSQPEHIGWYQIDDKFCGTIVILEWVFINFIISTTVNCLDNKLNN